MRGITVLMSCLALLGMLEAASADCIGGSSTAFTQVVSGGFHSCGLTAEGTAYCWGFDWDGQLGDGGSSQDSQMPVAVETGGITGEKAFIALTAGDTHTCGLTSEGVAYCWGYDFYGQLGDGGTGQDSQVPVAVDTSTIAGEKALVKLAAGDHHTCGLAADGRAYCWGRDNRGQLGAGGSAQDSQSPVLVDTSLIGGNQDFVALVGGSMHTCGLTADGAACCWGSDDFGELGDGGGSLDAQNPVAVDVSSITGEKVFAQLAAGGNYTCGLVADGRAYCWGYDGYGQLGDGGGPQDSQSPVAVDTSAVTGEKALTTLAGGYAHVCGATAEGVAYCWGRDEFGQLGDGGAVQDSQAPVPVDLIPVTGEKAFVQLGGGYYHSCGLTAEGVAYCWGDDDAGQLGDGGVSQDSQSPVPVDVSGVVGEVAFSWIAVGSYNSYGITAAGAVYGWGEDTHGELGNGGTGQRSWVPVSLDTTGMAGDKALVQVTGGGLHACGLTAAGEAYCWGADDCGQLGDGGTSNESQSPVAVDTSGINGEKAFIMLSAGYTHTCGLTSEGVPYCWGDDEFGRLGDGGSSTDAQSPVAVDTSGIAGEKIFIGISAGAEHTCGLTADGAAYCWGQDQSNQLGQGAEKLDSQVPVAVDRSVITGERAIVQLSAGSHHNCCLTSEGAAYCWGYGLFGQLGDGSTVSSAPVPVQVDTSGIIGEKAFVRIAGGRIHTCGLTAEGVAYCWGSDSYGKLGDGGSEQDSPAPVAVDVVNITGGKAFIDLAAGGDHNCGLTAEGGVYCWGADSQGQLGDDTLVVSQQSPVPIEQCPITCVTDADCPLCMECSAPDCVNQAAGSDVKEECPQAECLTGTCDGNRACGREPDDTTCGDQSDTACDNPDTCQGGSCRSNFEPAGTSCADTQFCNGEETCDGAGSCQAGSDPCFPQGCEESTDQCICTPIAPNDDTCDGVDDDCDGSTDEDYESVCGLGECTNFGSCIDGEESLCVPLAPPSTFDICEDGMDNDCDGLTDSEDVEDCSAPGPPLALIGIQPDRGSVPLDVVFDGSESRAYGGLSIRSYRWDFGDGSPWEYGVTVGHTYLLPGTYMAELTVTDEAGVTDAAKGAVSVWNMEGQNPPVARIVASATEGEGTLNVSFSCDCTWGDAPIEAYLWDFGDGTLSVEAETDNLFGVGRYRVKLTVVDENGLPGTDFVEIVVSEPGKTPPECKASVVPPAGVAPLSTSYVGYYADQDGQVEEIKWEFADGAVLHGDTVVKEYHEPGIFSARLAVTDNDGLSCHDSAEVTVSSSPGSVPPSIISIGNPAARCEEEYEYDQDKKPTARGSRPVEWSLGIEVGGEIIGSPEGMSINPVDGTINWVPSPKQAGQNRVSIVVSSRAGSDVQDLMVDVACEKDNDPGGCGCTSTSGGAPAVFTLFLWLVFCRNRKRGQSL